MSHQSFEYEDSVATVDEVIYPGRRGRVRFQGSWWYARCTLDVTLKSGQSVRVIGVINITLLVEPVIYSEDSTHLDDSSCFFK